MITTKKSRQSIHHNVKNNASSMDLKSRIEKNLFHVKESEVLEF